MHPCNVWKRHGGLLGMQDAVRAPIQLVSFSYSGTVQLRGRCYTWPGNGKRDIELDLSILVYYRIVNDPAGEQSV